MVGFSYKNRSALMAGVLFAAHAATGCGGGSEGSVDNARSETDAGDGQNDAALFDGTTNTYATDAANAPACGPGFATSVASVEYGAGAGFGQSQMPKSVLGPPQGKGEYAGSLDVVSLGVGGVITLAFKEGIKDEPGDDFIVFENAFVYGAGDVFAEPGEVSVSTDGTSWMAFPCQSTSYPYTGCAGWHPVYSNSQNGISPFDPGAAGGEAFDLSQLGVVEARFVRIRDLSTSGSAPYAGFDLDAISVIHPACR